MKMLNGIEIARIAYVANHNANDTTGDTRIKHRDVRDVIIHQGDDYVIVRMSHGETSPATIIVIGDDEGYVGGIIQYFDGITTIIM